jgi:nucleoside phosphorylase
MINILIVDDNPDKQKQIKSVITTILKEMKDIDINSSVDIASTKRIMNNKDINIMILDLYLPVRFEDGPELDGGKKLIQELIKSRRYKYPNYVISLSQHPERTQEFKEFTDEIHKYINYDSSNNEWAIELKKYLLSAIKTLQNNINHRTHMYDVAVICALSEELEYVKKSLEDVHQIEMAFDDFIYFSGYYNVSGKIIKVITTCSTQMGMAAAATLTTKMIHNFCPQYIVMTGIAAGVKGKTCMGDAVIAEYSWDYGAGKDILDENGNNEHRNTIQQIPIDAEIANKVRRLQLDQEFKKSVKEGFKKDKPENDFEIVMGAVASGAAVIANPEKVQEIIKHQVRDLLAIEMEVYGVYYASKWAIEPKPKFIAIKSICDYADTNKNDDYHEYASYTSVRVFEKLVKDYFEFD